jgi:hypothetical protein
MAVQRDRKSSKLDELVREVNDRVAELYRADDDGDELDFLCECGAKDCVGVVRLSASEYAERRQRGPILMAGHAPV